MLSDGDLRDRQIVDMRVKGKSEGDVARLLGCTIR
jgi:DNA-binding CsgD family transcriptional regulator